MKRLFTCLTIMSLFILVHQSAYAEAVFNKIAFTRQASDTHWDIWMMDADGSNQTQITHNTYQDRMPCFNPQGTKIAFARISTGFPPSGDIYIMDSNGSNQVNLTNSPLLTGMAMSPRFSWDGNKIIFDITAGSGGTQIWYMNSDGSGLTKFIDDGKDDRGPSFSPDGEWIVFARYTSAPPNLKSTIYKKPVSGGSLVQLTDGDHANEMPVYSPDGQYIVFQRENDIYRIPFDHNPSDTATLVNLTNKWGGNESDAPMYSSDGKKIAFMAMMSGPTSMEIYIMNEDGSGKTRLTNNSVADFDPSFSPAEPPVTTTYTVNVVKTGASPGTVTSDPAGIDCGSSCSAPFHTGTVVTLTARSDSGSAFQEWSGCPSPVGNTCRVTVTNDVTVTVAFTSGYTLSVIKTGSTSGTITSSPSGISCGAGCTSASHAFPGNQDVTLSAGNGADSAFSYWSGACEGAWSSCKLTMTGDATVSAVFVPNKTKRFTLVVSKTKQSKGDGTIQSHDLTINCGSTCRSSYYKNTPVTLSAMPGKDSIFTGWKPDSLNCKGTGDCPVAMSGTKTVQAIFVGPQKLTVIKQAVKRGTGTVTSSPAGINCGASCTSANAYYTFNQEVKLSATPSPGSIFTGWKPATLKCSGPNCTVTMPKATTVTAAFTKGSASKAGTSLP